MQFNSIDFLLFLPIVFSIYWSLNNKLHTQNIFILVASYIFYGWWNWRLLGLITLTSFLSWGLGLLCANPMLSRRKKKAITISNICINLFILGIFKYYNFFADNLINLLSLFGIYTHISTLQLILPVGISFYTFQALSYTIDIYKGRLEPTKDIIAFFAYVSFFPQLVAGPIERATNLLPQFLNKRMFQYENAVDGMRQILWGLFMKIVIADNCASIVNVIYNNFTTSNWLALSIGAVLFTFQIYGDFAGYSHIAIGCAKLFGFSLLNNFYLPYQSVNIPDFWRRWHISLNSWFRDYVYIPLGGNRKGKMKQIRNTLIVFGLSGLWHGANWTYVFWGFYHGILTIPNIIFRGKTRDGEKQNILKVMRTFLLVIIGWIFFRAVTIADAFHFIFRVALFKSGNTITDLGISKITMLSTMFFVLMLIVIESINKSKNHPLEIFANSRGFRWTFYLIITLSIIIFPGKSETFIYFQF